MDSATELKLLHENEARLYEEFALETTQNQHVESIDLKNPLASILRVALSDIICSQIVDTSKKPQSSLRIYPTAMYLYDDNTRMCARMVLNKENCEIKEVLFENKGNSEERIKTFRNDLFVGALLSNYSQTNAFKDSSNNYEEFEKHFKNQKIDDCIGAFINHYNSAESEGKNKNDIGSISYRVFIFYNLYDKDAIQVTKVTDYTFIQHFLKKLFVLAISTKRNKQFFNDIRQKSLKTSLSSCMARNQSHNIGSHVLSRFSQESDLANVLQEFKDAQFINYDNIKVGDVNNWQSAFEVEKATLIKKMENLTFFEKWEKISRLNIHKNKNVRNLLARHELSNKRIAIFNNYMKERQELLAEIASTVPVIQTNKKFNEEVLQGFTDNRILLDRISGIDNFKFTFKLDIQLGNPKLEEINIAIANDVLGQQAFYIILENIIRNTAKHGSKIAAKTTKTKNGKEQEKGELPEKVIFTIRVTESTLDNSYYQITVFDDVIADLTPEKIICENKKNDVEKKKYYGDFISYSSIEGCENKTDKICVCGEIPKLTKLIIDQNIKINLPILNDDNELRTEALGMIEMEACAAYLRKLPIEKIQSEDYMLAFSREARDELKEKISNKDGSLRILRAVNPFNEKGLNKLKNASDTKKKKIKAELKYRENVLGYRFYLPKPKELLIIDTTNKLYKELNDSLLQEAKREGVTILAVKSENLKKIGNREALESKNDKVDYFDSNIIYPHEQLLVIGDLDEIKHPGKYLKGVNDYIKIYLPKRKLKVDILEIDKTEGGLFKNLIKGNYNLLKAEVLRKIVEAKMEDKKLLLIYEDSPSYYQEVINKPTENNYVNLMFNFNDHGTNYKTLSAKCFNQILTHKEKPFYNKNLIEYPDNFTNPVAVAKMFDSFLNNIVVLDERIQEKAETRYALLKNVDRPDISYREIWQNVGCFIPLKVGDQIDLSSSDFSKTEKNIIKWIKGLRRGKLKTEISKEKKITEIENRTYKNIDTLIIHIGVIEKMLAAKGKNKECPKKKKKLVHRLLNGDFKNVNIILTSGRAPRKENLVPGFSFLTISIVSEYLINNRFKYNLNELCNLARPKI
jgi:hypothetical protein